MNDSHNLVPVACLLAPRSASSYKLYLKRCSCHIQHVHGLVAVSGLLLPQRPCHTPLDAWGRLSPFVRLLQEVVGDERTALQAVVAADLELMELREEEEQINKQLQDTSLEDKPKGFDADEASERLNEVSPSKDPTVCTMKPASVSHARA